MSLVDGTYIARLKLNNLGQVYLPGASVPGSAFSGEAQVVEYIRRGWIDVDSSSGSSSTEAGESVRTKTFATTSVGTSLTAINGLAVLEFTVTDYEWEVIVDLPYILAGATNGAIAVTVTDSTDTNIRYQVGATALVANLASGLRFSAPFDSPGDYSVRLHGQRFNTASCTVGSGIEPPTAGGVYSSMVARKTSTLIDV